LIESKAEGEAPMGVNASAEHWVPECEGKPPSNSDEEESTCISTVFTVQAGKTYWAIVEEDYIEKAAADARAAESMAKFKAKQEAQEEGAREIKTEKVEGCSCIWVRNYNTFYPLLRCIFFVNSTPLYFLLFRETLAKRSL